MSSISADGRVVMLSGANRGMGAAIATRLAADGYRLSLGARRLDALAQVAPDIGPDRVLLNYHEATDFDSARDWVQATVDHFGGIDVLVNNAGIVDRTGLESVEEAVLDEMWAVNVKGPLRLIRQALPHLRRSGSGRVVNMASLSAKRVKGDSIVGYSMTKYALLALSHAIRQIGWDDGVRVTAICPGPVATDMMDPDDDTITQPEDVADLVATVIALPNTASVSELLIGCRLEAWA
ncbi:MAG: SDR family NAD(P)-dependent oxidoreductase [Acidimicrobiaceae bacterium]|nr:SDR family NAD(P)-dependent oxidoreductase [Acidimicrobiaceae bacterium]MYH00045.1 SDR family NAD(P)-dependent oxidoreductase [Acidimicrobiaceae bacterium]MYL04297.1 SDR family NAD(P)-dependent oxidoreductase [Acidimicrobiaceae bacterium]